MKYLFITLAFSLCSIFLIAQNTVIIVKSDTSETLYTNLDTAIINAPAGSVVTIPGGNFSINQPIDKELHLRGAGTFPSATLVTGQTMVSVNASLNLNFGGTIYNRPNTLFKFGADGSSVEGIWFSTNVAFNGRDSSTNEKLENLGFFKCFFEYNLYGEDIDIASQGLVIRNCIINQTTASTFRLLRLPLLMENCIIEGTLYSMNNATVSNCVFLSLTAGPIGEGNFKSSNSIFKNCIFRTDNLPIGSSQGNLFHNNIYFKSSGNLNFPISSTNNINVPSLDSIFINYSSTETQFSFNFDYHLKPTSAGINGGMGGTNIGIYGGSTPFVEEAIPSIPHIQSKSIPTNTDGNGMLHIQMTIEARNN